MSLKDLHLELARITQSIELLSAEQKSPLIPSLNRCNQLIDDLVLVQSHFHNPHPRSRTYRSAPLAWKINDVNASNLKKSIQNSIAQSTQKSAMVFDLDGTLFDVSHRTLGILQNWLSSRESQNFHARVLRQIKLIDLSHIGYSLSHAFENAGLNLRDADVLDAFNSAESYWRNTFFDGKSLNQFDKPFAGAADFVNSFHKSGVQIVYLSGRHDKVMRPGTKAQLEQGGFPLIGCEIVLKTDHAQEDNEFKGEAFKAICSKFNVVANFENEYINIAAMLQWNQNCSQVIFDSQHSGRNCPDIPTDISRLENWII